VLERAARRSAGEGLARAHDVAATPIDTRRFAERLGAWLTTSGPEADVVVSCRVRLARNVAGRPFTPRLEPAEALELCAELREHLVALALDGETLWVPIEEASLLVRLLLRERHLISRDLAPVEENRPLPPGRAAAFGRSESLAVMVNEEDHLRLQAMAPGLDLALAFERVRELDRRMEERVRYAWTEPLGYLTSCPTNVGTGLRASVMLHLPALGLVRSELEKVFTAAQRTGLAVRGLYGEGSRAAGDFYQVSNQVTLGRSEEQLVDDLRALVPRIVDFERKLRETLLEEQRAALQDRVARSLGLLRTARAMPTDGALAHLSNVRLGTLQKAHVQALSAPEGEAELLEASQRDRLRAALLRRRLK
jgi:protein arginine kinase